MKVISIKEPWASLILEGYKHFEFRTWKTKYRGEIYIHTSKTVDKEAMKHFENLNLDYKRGYIIGKANLDDCIEVNKEFEDSLIKENQQVYGLTKGRSGFAWKISNPKRIESIKINGQLGIWEYKK